MKKLLWIDGAIVLGAFAIGAYSYHLMPEWMPVHWGAHGPDGYGSRFTGVFLLPFLVAIITALMLSAPAADPVKRKLTKTQRYSRVAAVIVPLVLVFIYTQTLIWAAGGHTDILLPLFAALLVYRLVSYFENSVAVGNHRGEVRRTTLNASGRPKSLPGVAAVYKTLATFPLLAIIFPTYKIHMITIPFLLAFALGITFFCLTVSFRTKQGN